MQLHPKEFIKIDFHFETMKLKPEISFFPKSSLVSIILCTFA